MSFKLSDEFLKKYENNSSMQEIIENAKPYIDEIKASNEDRELLLEALYAIKHTVAQEAGIPVERFYKKLHLIETIDYEQSAQENWGGCCQLNDDLSVRPVSIYINSRCNDFSDNVKRAIIIHEFCHALSTDVKMKENGERLFRANGLGVGGDEVVTECMSRDICNYLGYGISPKEITLLNDSDGLVKEGKMIATSPGYMTTNGYADILKSVYGADTIYKDKLLRFGEIYRGERLHFHNIKLTDISDSIEAVWENDRDIQLHLNAEHLMAEKFMVIKTKYDVEDIGSYLDVTKKMVERGMELSLEDGSHFNSISAYLQPREIVAIYCKMNDITSSEEKISEVNPMTRSGKCKEFLVVMEALRESSIDFSHEDFLKMKYERAIINGQEVVELKLGKTKYEIPYSYDEELGIAKPTSITEMSNFRKITSAFNAVVEDHGDGPSYLNIAESNRYTDFVSVIAREMERGSISDSYESYILGKVISSKEITDEDFLIFPQVLAETDLKQLSDKNGNNIFHILAKMNTPEAEETMRIIMNYCPEAVGELISSPNNDGVTPLHMACTEGGYTLLKQTVINNLPDISKTALVDYEISLPDGSSTKLSALVIDSKDKEFIFGMLEKGMSINATNENGETLAHLIADGKIKDITFDELVKAGGDLELRDKEGMTPIEMAASNGNLDAVRGLLEAGVDPFKEGESGMSFRDFVADSGNYEAFKVLIEAGCDIDKIDVDNTPFIEEQKEELINYAKVVAAELEENAEDEAKIKDDIDNDFDFGF